MPRDRKELLESIAANVAAGRRKQSLTQEGLAEKSGVDVRTIQDMEGARYNVTIITLYSVAESLNTDIDSLLKHAKKKRPVRGRPPKNPPKD